MRKSRVSAAALAIVAIVACAPACAPTTHGSYPSTLGTPSRARDLLAVIDEPGPVELTTIVSADWAVDLDGLLNLDDPRAKAAGLTNRSEPIQIYFYALRHPTFGLYIVDTGVERAARDDKEHQAVKGLVARAMSWDALKVRTALGDFLKTEKSHLRGVFLTHLHIDHISGMPDVPHGTPIVAGPGESADKAFINMFVTDTTDRELEMQAPIEEWSFLPDPDKRFFGVHDVFGDGSVWAIHTPGHTKGSTAYVVRTPKGPVLLVGDTCHTAWGWNNGVEPGRFTAYHELNKASLAILRTLAKEHPNMEVHIGHQPLTPPPPGALPLPPPAPLTPSN